jgi:microcystin-dependent protein
LKKIFALVALVLMVGALWSPSQAQQEGFIGEIRMFGGNFAPRGWAMCEGQLLPIAQHQALFSVLGTTYGGDGRTTFALPDMRGRVTIHPGQGHGLTAHRLGQKGGQEQVTLTVNEMPSHTHTVKQTLQDVTAGKKTNDTAAGSLPQETKINPTQKPFSPAAASVQSAPGKKPAEISINATGGGQAHENMPPYVAINYIICLNGVYPSRN